MITLAQVTSAPRENALARKGDWITCVFGHPICQVAKPMWRRSPYTPSHFTRWHIVEPAIGTPEAKARCHCGAKWFRGRHGYRGVSLHFEHGAWR